MTSIRKKKELEEKSNVNKDSADDKLPTEDFNETTMLLHWTNYAQRLGNKGFKIMEALMLMNDPVLDGTKITFELTNQGSKLDFEKEKSGLMGYLKGHLHNHNITIDVIVNESLQIKRPMNDIDRYNKLYEINPNIDLLKSTFGLEIDV